MVKLKNHAIFIADSHYNKKRVTLVKLLKDIESKNIECNQLFLCGDIFDFLCSQATYFKNINNSVIELINTISFHIEVIYLEGNHDYSLKPLFPNSLVVPRDSQPLVIQNNEKNIQISHGDIFTSITYNLYCSIIRNPLFLKFLNIIDINYWLTYKIEQGLMKKSICHHKDNFKSFTQKRLKEYGTDDLVIEGHFHQGYKDKHYINIPSLYCSNKYMVYKEKQFKFHML